MFILHLSVCTCYLFEEIFSEPIKLDFLLLIALAIFASIITSIITFMSTEWCHLVLTYKYPSLDSKFIFKSVTWYSKVIYKLMNEYKYLCCA